MTDNLIMWIYADSKASQLRDVFDNHNNLICTVERSTARRIVLAMNATRQLDTESIKKLADGGIDNYLKTLVKEAVDNGS